MRKTNLFYSTGQDSNFVTFSNYTEALTGNILATNCKMFPSKFVCLYIPLLDKGNDANPTEAFNDEKKNFIKEYLVAHYENKLAVIRDWCIYENNKKPEDILNPLDYLLDIIYQYDASTQITFIGDICEQEYNGTFMDNICIIENNAQPKLYEYTVSHSDSTIDVQSFITSYFANYTANDNTNNYVTKLYGWAKAQLPNEYNALTAKYDFLDQYRYWYDSTSSIAETLAVEEIQTDDPENPTTSVPLTKIKFNVLIPLFDVFEWLKNDYLDEPCQEKPNDMVLLLNSHSTNNVHNQYDVPIGMWFSDKTIELDRSIDAVSQGSTYRPSWSLCISAQFKPFPYSDGYPNEIDECQNPDKFASFAMIMAKQAFIVDEFNTLSENYVNLANEVKDLSILVRTLQGIENESNGSSVNSSDIELINNQLSTLSTTINTHAASIQHIQRNYLETRNLYSTTLELGFLTADGVNSLLSENYVTNSSLQTFLYDHSYINSSNIDTYLEDSNIIYNISKFNYVNDEYGINMPQSLNNAVTNSDIAQKLKGICDGSWNKVFQVGSNDAKEGYSIPDIYSYCHTDLTNAYQSSYTYLLKRIQAIDGMGFYDNVQPGITAQLSLADTLVETFNKLENEHLLTIKNLFSYLLTRTTLFGGRQYSLGLDPSGDYGNLTQEDGEYKTAIKDILLSNNWQEIYGGNNTVVYPVIVSVSPDDAGTVSGTGNYQKDANCTLVATANDGYVFDKWLSTSNQQLGTETSYSFAVSGVTQLIASFTQTN